ncbi:MAG: hypothetical protein K5930_09980 [Treponemataceae bacterium]|nr:hypothetical protein [Treponemataceae bacterium]
MESGGEKTKNRSEVKSKAAKHRVAAWPCFSLNGGYTFVRLAFPYCERFMNPFPFEELQKIVELNDTELVTDELLFKSTISYIEKELDYPLEDRNYNELQTVRDCKVYINQDNITEMVNIIDMNTKLRVPNCVIDGRTIFLLDTKLEGHVLFLNYNAGFLPETFPEDLKEAIIKIFLLKKKEFIKQMNHEDDCSFEIPMDVQKIIEHYRRKNY